MSGDTSDTSIEIKLTIKGPWIQHLWDFVALEHEVLVRPQLNWIVTWVLKSHVSAELSHKLQQEADHLCHLLAQEELHSRGWQEEIKELRKELHQNKRQLRGECYFQRKRLSREIDVRGPRDLGWCGGGWQKLQTRVPPLHAVDGQRPWCHASASTEQRSLPQKTLPQRTPGTGWRHGHISSNQMWNFSRPRRLKKNLKTHYSRSSTWSISRWTQMWVKCCRRLTNRTRARIVTQPLLLLKWKHHQLLNPKPPLCQIVVSYIEKKWKRYWSLQNFRFELMVKGGDGTLGFQ